MHSRHYLDTKATAIFCCFEKIEKFNGLTINVAAPVGEIQPRMMSELTRLPRNVKAKLTQPLVTTWSCNEKKES